MWVIRYFSWIFKIHVLKIQGNLDDHISNEMLARLFITFGEIKSIEIPVDHVTSNIKDLI